MDYWALGHIHRRQYLGEGDPWIVYPGNLQGRSPKPSERGPKGAVVVEVKGSTVTRVTPVALDRVRFVAEDVDIDGLDDLPVLVSSLAERAERLRSENAGRGLLLRAYLTGRGAIARELRRQGVVDDLLRELRDQAVGSRPFLWWESIRDGTRPDLDMEAIRGRGDFSAELVNLVAELTRDPDRLASFLATRTRGLKQAKLRTLLPDLDPGEAREELSRAQLLALGLLEEEDA
jgi:DNA repair exonuclease SbcCD nuclease subunit